MRGRRVGPGDVTANQRGTLRSRSRARIAVVVAERQGDAWLLKLACGHTAERHAARIVYPPYLYLAAPKHVYCAQCPLRRSIPFEHEERLADFDARLARACDSA